jgi:hypothetical protein
LGIHIFNLDNIRRADYRTRTATDTHSGLHFKWCAYLAIGAPINEADGSCADRFSANPHTQTAQDAVFILVLIRLEARIRHTDISCLNIDARMRRRRLHHGPNEVLAIGMLDRTGNLTGLASSTQLRTYKESIHAI